jgi:hypothetical protein
VTAVPAYLHANPLLLALVKKFAQGNYQRLVGYSPSEIPQS